MKTKIYRRQLNIICLFFFFQSFVPQLSAQQKSDEVCSCGKAKVDVKADKTNTGIAEGTLLQYPGGPGVKGAFICLMKDNKCFAKTKTGKNGAFSIKNLANGNYLVIACSSSFGSKEIAGFEVRSGKVTFLNIFLKDSK